MSNKKDQCGTCSFKDLCRDYFYFHDGAGKDKKCNMFVKGREVNKLIKKGVNMEKLNFYSCYIRTQKYGNYLKISGGAYTMADFRDNVEASGNKIETKIRFIKTANIIKK